MAVGTVTTAASTYTLTGTYWFVRNSKSEDRD
jgi:hypothetical protein